MDLSDYQILALATDDTRGSADPNLVPILGLAGEAGSVLTEFKKARRTRPCEDDYLLREVMLVELGDVLWYTAVVAERFGLNLNEIAERNLAKAKNLWTYPAERPAAYDYDYPVWEQLPAEFQITVRSIDDGRVALACDGIKIGDPLTDNAYVEDGYRFHDVFHFAYAAVLGWSPVARGIMGLKRRSNLIKDRVDDGGRAIVIEEGISAFVFSCAREHLFGNGESLDMVVLQTIKTMVHGLEVGSRTVSEWREAIRQGFEVFRLLVNNDGGVIRVSTVERRVEYLGALG